MNSFIKTTLMILSLVLTLSQTANSMDEAALMQAVYNSNVPEVALRDAVALREQISHTTRSFKYFELTPLENRPNTMGFVDHILEGVAPTIGDGQFIVIFDLNLHSSTDRLHIINLSTGATESVQAAHGVESDCGGKRAGFACKFISDRESKASPLGFFVTGETYLADSGTAIRLNGLESKSNGFSGNDVASTIIIHGADYVQTGRRAGNSWGCPAMNPNILEKVKSKLPAGTLFYFYHSSLNFSGRNPVVETQK